MRYYGHWYLSVCPSLIQTYCIWSHFKQKTKIKECWFISFCLQGGANYQGSLISSWFVSTGAEKWMDDVRKTVCEGIDEHSGLHVVEWYCSLIAIYIDSNPWWSEVDRQAGWRLCSKGVIVPIPQAEEPVTIGRAYCDFSLPIYRPACHSQVPVCLSSHLNLGDSIWLQWVHCDHLWGCRPNQQGISYFFINKTITGSFTYS